MMLLEQQRPGVDFMGVLYGFGFKNELDLINYKNIGCIKDAKDSSVLDKLGR
jgi:hypothetical protein